MKGYFDKPLKYLFLDFLILSSPITGLLALLFLIDPKWRERPEKWWSVELYEPFVRRSLIRHALMILLFSSMALSGVVIYILHLMRFV